MTQFLMPGLALVWLFGAWIRIYRQARFFQIEEYMSRRYMAWVWRNRPHLLPMRPLAAWMIALVLIALLAETQTSTLLYIIAFSAALIAALPPTETEIKKPLVLTGRLKRILAASFLLSSLVPAVAFFAIHMFLAWDSPGSDILLISSCGIALFLLTPLWLTLGSQLLQPYEAYQRRRYLRQARDILEQINPKIIGITGSYGKTTTKVFLREILNVRFRSYATPKSYNTLMGISLAINRDLAQDFSCEYFISEMGAYVPGEIARICQLTPPDIAIVTEIGPQHLERFGSLENVKRAKYEIVTNLAPDGVAIFNWDNAYIREMIAEGYPNTRLTVSRTLDHESAGEQGVSWIAGNILESLSGLGFDVTHVASGESAHISTGIVGEHNVTNLLLCIALAYHEGIPLRDIARRISSLQPAESRLVRQTTANGITIINDAYSANPQGVVSALKVLGMHRKGKRLLITPGMIELGAMQDEENSKLGTMATQHATDIILVGHQQTKAIHEAIQSASFDMSRVQVFETLAEAVSWYQQHLAANDTVLFLNDLPDTY